MSVTHPLAWWLANDIVLTNGQVGYISDYGNAFKVGDGNNPFSGLALQGLDKGSMWFSDFALRYSKAGVLTTVTKRTLIGGTFVQEGGYCEFEFIIMPVSSSTNKTAYIKFSNQIICSILVPKGSAETIKVNGFIKCIEYLNQKAVAIVEKNNYNALTGFTITDMTGIDWAASNDLLLQFETDSYEDLMYKTGHGRLYPVSRLILN